MFDNRTVTAADCEAMNFRHDHAGIVRRLEKSVEGSMQDIDYEGNHNERTASGGNRKAPEEKVIQK